MVTIARIAEESSPGTSSGRDPRFLIGPAADVVLLILSPLLAVAVTAAISGTWATTRTRILGVEQPPHELFIGVLIAAHLVASFFRSHGNPSVFGAHRLRFTLVPALLLVAIAGSTWIRATAATLAVLWDVHHSGLQTFGLARMYDSKAGVPPEQGRGLDLWLNHLLYAGPILAGAGFMHHAYALYAFEAVGDGILTAAPAHLRNYRPWLALAVVAIGIPFLCMYVLDHVRRYRSGRPVSPLKVALLGATGLASILSWGLDTFAAALFTMKLFHVVQYFTLVGWMERSRLGGGTGGHRAGADQDRRAFATALVMLLVIGGVYGIWARLMVVIPNRSELAMSVVITVTLLHFWYDGFMWSVRRRQL